MVVEEEKKAPQTQLELFAENLPHKPYCTDEKGWLQVRKKATAIGKKYIQHNQPSLCHWLVYDCDYAGALEHVGDNQLPAPNIIATNPKTGTVTCSTGLLTLFAPVNLHTANRWHCLQKLTMCCAKN